VESLTFRDHNVRMRRGRRRLWLAAAAGAALCALALVQRGAAGPRSLGAYLVGPKLVRAEVVLKDGAELHDYRIDRGRIRAVSAGSLTLLERDGTLVTVPVASGADVRLAGRAVKLARLRRGFVATTVRDGDAPAKSVEATRR
jgi:ferric-dicitrate binding protein FerR (iron transport regulator)